MKSTIVSVTGHQREFVSRTIHHSATVAIENYDPSEKDEITAQVSIKVGYHPAGYGLYDRFTTIAPTENENEFLIRWRTSDNCD